MKIIGVLVILFLVCPVHSSAQRWKEYADSAAKFDDKNTDKAIEVYYKARWQLQQDSGMTATNAFVATSIAMAYVKLGKNDSAEAYFVEAMQIRERVLSKKDRRYAESYYNLGVLYTNTGNFEKSERFLVDALTMRRNNFGKEDEDYIQSAAGLGALYETIGKNDQAEALFIEARELRKKISGTENIDYALMCNSLGSFYNNARKNEPAEKLFLEAREIFARVAGKNDARYAAICDNLANIYRETQRYKEAQDFALEANAIAKQILHEDDPEYAIYCNNLGILYNEIGNYQKAEPAILEANRIWTKAYGKNHYYVGVTDGNLALLYHDIGEIEKAEQYYFLSKQILAVNPGKDDPMYAMSCNNLGNFYIDQGQYEKAEKLFLEGKMLLEKIVGRDNNDYASSCENLANLYFNWNKNDQAEPLYLESKQIIEKIMGKDKPDYAQCCINLANLYSSKGERKRAERLYLEAKEIEANTHGRNHRDYASCCNKLAELYASMGQFSKAELLYKEAKQIMQNVFGKDHLLYAQSCNDLANLYWAEKKNIDANRFYLEALRSQNIQVRKMFRFTNEMEKQLYLKKYDDLLQYYLSFNLAAPQSKNLIYDLSLFNRNIILSSSQQLRYASYHTQDSSMLKKYEEWIGTREQIAFWTAKPREERPDFFNELKEKSAMLEKTLTRLSSDFDHQQKQAEVTWDKIQSHLTAQEAAVEFMQFKYFNGNRWTDSIYYLALIVTKNGMKPVTVKLFEQRQLDALLQDRSSRVSGNIAALYSRGAGVVNRTSTTKSIYSLIWKPMEKYLKGINKVYFAPAGSLYRISFAALPVGQQRVLSDQYRLVQLTTTAALLDSSADHLGQTDRICLYGGVMYDADSASIKKEVASIPAKYMATRSLPDDLTRSEAWNFLPGTEKEISQIDTLGLNSHYSLAVYRGIQATEESIKEMNGERSPAILHIASHGFFFPDPQTQLIDKTSGIENGQTFRQSDDPLFRSGILLAGANNAWKGKAVTGIEDGILTSYEVSNLYLPNTKLVVLSACETGLGDIEGSEGVYGLQRAFKMAGVDYLIMSLWKVPDEETAQFMQLFYKHLFAGETIPNSFYNAQSAMKVQYKIDPYKWAAWILVR